MEYLQEDKHEGIHYNRNRLLEKSNRYKNYFKNKESINNTL